MPSPTVPAKSSKPFSIIGRLPEPILRRLPSWLVDSPNRIPTFLSDESGAVHIDPSIHLYDEETLKKIPSKFREDFRKGTIPRDLADRIIAASQADFSKTVKDIDDIEKSFDLENYERKLNYNTDFKQQRIDKAKGTFDESSYDPSLKDEYFEDEDKSTFVKRKLDERRAALEKSVLYRLLDDPNVAAFFDFAKLFSDDVYDFSHFGTIKNKLSRSKKLTNDEDLLLRKYSRFFPPDLAARALRRRFKPRSEPSHITETLDAPASTGEGQSISGVSLDSPPNFFLDADASEISPALENEILQMLRSYYSSHLVPDLHRKIPGRDLFKLTPLAVSYFQRKLSGSKFKDYLSVIESRLSELNSGALPDLVDASEYVKQKRQRISEKKELSAQESELVNLGMDLYQQIPEYLANRDSFPYSHQAGFDAIAGRFRDGQKHDRAYFADLAQEFLDASRHYKPFPANPNSFKDYGDFATDKKSGDVKRFRKDGNKFFEDQYGDYIRSSDGEYVSMKESVGEVEPFSRSDESVLGSNSAEGLPPGEDASTVSAGGGVQEDDSIKYVPSRNDHKSESYTVLVPQGWTLSEENYTPDNRPLGDTRYGFFDLFYPRSRFPLYRESGGVSVNSPWRFTSLKDFADYFYLLNSNKNTSDPTPVIAFDFEDPSLLNAASKSRSFGIDSFLRPEFIEALNRAAALARQTGIPANIALDLVPSRQFFNLTELPTGDSFDPELLKQTIYDYLFYQYPDLFPESGPLIRFFTSNHPNELYRPLASYTPTGEPLYSPAYFKGFDNRYGQRLLTNFLRATTPEDQNAALLKLTPALSRFATRGYNFYDYNRSRIERDVSYPDLRRAFAYLSDGNIPAALSFYQRHINNAAPSEAFTSFKDDPRNLVLGLLDAIQGFLNERP